MRLYLGLIASALFFVCAVTFFYPLIVVGATSLGAPDGTLTAANYIEVVGSHYYLRALVETSMFCVATSAVAVAWALPLAWRMGRDLRGARLLRGISQLNSAFAGILYGMLMIALMGNAGALTIIEARIFGTEHSAGLVYTTFGLALTYLSFQIPRAALIIAEAVAKLDPSLLKAARTLGARGLDVALLVSLPLIRPAIIDAFAFSFVLSMGSFGPALLIARSVTIYPAVVYREFTGFLNFGVAAAMALLLALIVIVANLAARALAGKTGRTLPEPRVI